MKTFKDLDFNAHEVTEGIHATCDFDNGYGVSVISGPRFYTDINHPYELAVLYKGQLCYTTKFTDDVIGHLNARQVTYYMKGIQSL